MHVLIDGGNSGSGGYIRFLRGILSAGAISADTSVSLLCSPEIAAEMGELDESVAVLSEPALSSPLLLQRKRWWWRSYPELVQRIAPDVVFHPSGVVRGDAGRVPSVISILNMLPFDMREIRRYGVSRQAATFLRWRMRAMISLRKADGVIFQSDYVRRAVNRQVRSIKAQTVVPAAIDKHFRADEKPLPKLLSPAIKVLYVSTIYLYKHQWHVVEAVSSLRKELGLDIRLSLFGRGEPVAERKLARRIKDLGAGEFTTVAGDTPLNEDQMAALYRSADLFVFASSCESFPTILLEAMGAGLPIASSDRCAMPDILRDGGVYFDPEKPKTIVAALRELVSDPELRLRCATKAHERESQYSWARTAGQVFAFLGEVSGAPAP
jgi:glycosyltransferase involved in cell wall biosynthesis